MVQCAPSNMERHVGLFHFKNRHQQRKWAKKSVQYSEKKICARRGNFAQFECEKKNEHKKAQQLKFVRERRNICILFYLKITVYDLVGSLIQCFVCDYFE